MTQTDRQTDYTHTDRRHDIFCSTPRDRQKSKFWSKFEIKIFSDFLDDYNASLYKDKEAKVSVFARDQTWISYLPGRHVTVTPQGQVLPMFQFEMLGLFSRIICWFNMKPNIWSKASKCQATVFIILMSVYKIPLSKTVFAFGKDNISLSPDI